MTFEQYNKACNFVAEQTNNKDLAVEIVNELCDIFNLHPTETKDEFMMKILAVLLGAE